MIPPRRIALTPVISDQEREQILRDIAGLWLEIERLIGQNESINRRHREALERIVALHHKLAG